MDQPYTTSLDSHRGLHLRLTEKVESKEGECLLRRELEGCIQKKHLSIWVQMGVENGHLIELMCKELHFKLHHALERDIVLYRWFPERSDLVVPYSIFIIGCGAIVIRDGKILLVQQKSGKRKGYFNCPCGRADANETIQSCAQRELLQETGIKGTFIGILGVREKLGDLYGSVDVHFFCLVDATAEGAMDGFKLCDQEIMSAKWVPLDQLESFADTHCILTYQKFLKYLASLHRQKVDLRHIATNYDSSNLGIRWHLKSAL